LESNFDVRPSIPTVSKRLGAFKLSTRLTGARPMPIGMTRDEYVLGYHEFVLGLHSSGFWNFDPNKIVCIDFVTNSRRRERETTLDFVGAPQKKIEGKLPTHTHSYLVAVTLGGDDDYLPLMFTFDEDLDPTGRNKREVRSLCRKFGLLTEQIVFKKSSKKYCKEDNSQVAHFKNIYRHELRGTRVLADAGNSFKLHRQFILEDGADRYVTFPPAQHGQLSVLDNKLNAVAKALWKAERTNTNFQHDSILLLYCLQRVGRDAISSWWESNFLLKKNQPTVQDVEDMLGAVNGTEPKNAHLAKQYKAKYEAWSAENVELGAEPIPKQLRTTLDGVKYKKTKK